MPFIGHYFGIAKQKEVLILTLIGICCTILDESLINLNSNLHKVWDAPMDTLSFSSITQNYIRYILCGVVLVRSFTVHLYLAFYIVILWPIVFEERSALFIPWLLIGLIKNLLMGVVTLIVGMYICLFSQDYRSACTEFFLSQLLNQGPSFYVWFCVFSYYRELRSTVTLYPPTIVKSIQNSEEITLRRRKVRSMTENSDLKCFIALDEERRLLSESTIENLVQQLTMNLPKNTRSLDTLMTSMAAEAVLMGVCDKNNLEIPGDTLQEKAKKFLKLTEGDIANVKLQKQSNKGESLLGSVLSDALSDEVEASTPKSNAATVVEKPPEVKEDNLKLPPNADTLSDVSEIEIRPVLNYSSTTISVGKERIIQRKIDEKNQKCLIPLRIPNYISKTVLLEADSKNQSNVSSTEKFCSHAELKKTSRTCDFTCQASTLSKNILKLSNLELLKIYRCGFQRNSIRSIKSSIVVNKSLDKCHAVQTTNSLKISERKVPFKVDGYTIAYLTEMGKQKNV